MDREKKGKSGLKEWLIGHKIYFDTLAATLLAIMALIMSIVQIYLSIHQSNLLNIQTKVAKEGSLPQFTVSAIQTLDYVTGKYISDEIHIVNHGEIAMNINSSTAVFFLIETDQGDTLKIAVTDYYNRSVYSNTAIGKLITISREEKYKTVLQLKEELRDKGILDLTIKRYVRLNYQDIFGDNNTKYYQSDLIHGSEIISKENGEFIFSNYYTSIEKQEEYTLNAISSQYILSLL